MSPFSEIPKHVQDVLEGFPGSTSRRNLLKSAGLLVVSLAGLDLNPIAQLADAQAAPTAGPYPDVDFHQLDSWIVIHEDNSATFYFGKTDCGQGTGTSFRQIMSDELDIAYEKTACVMGRTDITVDQNGSGGSTAMERDSWPMRRTAAEARRGSRRESPRAARSRTARSVRAAPAPPARRRPA